MNVKLHPHLIKRLEERKGIDKKKHTVSFIRDTFVQIINKDWDIKYSREWKYVVENAIHKFILYRNKKWEYVILTYVYKWIMNTLKKLVYKN